MHAPLHLHLAAVLALLPAIAWSQEKDAQVTELPLSEVVLFSSGVAFHQRNAEVEDNATVELKFETKDINDLLKSMVVQDLGGGQVSTVNYASRDPISKTLKTFTIDLTTNPTMGDLLNQIRGEKIVVHAPGEIAGTILGVQRKPVKVKDETIVVEKLNLLTAAGLRSVELSQIQQIKLARPELEAELRQALTILATAHQTDKKSVALRFQGKGKRPVRVGYITESPVWKTSYRLVLDDEGGALLQGWAIVENTSEEDWKDVRLTLVSGRPISFMMDLYTPLYLDRPVVQPELYASLRPQSYDQDLARADEQFRALAKKDKAFSGKTESLAEAEESQFGALRQRAQERKNMLDRMADSKSVKSMAQAGDVGELFRYAIDTPVSIGRRQSAMLPVVNDTVKLEKLSIYNESVQAKHPLSGVRLKNTTDLHLMQGPITVFDGGNYAGDAKIQDLSPGSERLVSYALDLNTEVAPVSNQKPEQLLKIKLFKGTLISDYKARKTRGFTIKNSGKQPKTILLEHPKDSNWKLLSPKADEVTRDRYRFAVKAEPGKPEKLEVVEERQYRQSVGLSNLDIKRIQYWISRKTASEAVKKALENVIDMKMELSELSRKRTRLEQELSQIESEQSRIRQNLPRLQQGSDLYNRYVKKLGDQEDRIEAIRAEVARLREAEAAQQKKLDTYLMGLDLE